MTDQELKDLVAENARSIRELRDSQKETDRQIRETSREIRELRASQESTQESLRATQEETARQIRELGKQIGEIPWPHRGVKNGAASSNPWTRRTKVTTPPAS